VKHNLGKLFLGLILLACADVQAQTASTKTDITKLIRSAQLNGQAMSQRVFDYSWKSKTLVRNYKRARLLKEVEQDHEVYPAPGLTYVAQKLVKENGLPLSAKRAAKEQKRFSEELKAAELEQAIFSNQMQSSENKTGCPTFGIWTVLNSPGGTETSLGISDFLCFATFFGPHKERRNEREMIVLQFRPRENFVAPAKEKTPFTKLVGALWIDAEDKVVAHIDAWVVDSARTFQGPLPNTPAVVVFDDMRMSDGMWVRRERYVDTRKDPLAFNGLNLEWKQEFTGYQKYYAETKGFTVNEPKVPNEKHPNP
jgi:hypothetical protein